MTASLWTHIAKRLGTFGVEVDCEGSYIHLKYDGIVSRIRREDRHEEAFAEYLSLQASLFDVNDWTYSNENELIVPLIRLDQGQARDEDIAFVGEDGDEVIIGRSSLAYSFALIDSSAYETFFKSVVSTKLKRESKITRTANILWRVPVSATFNPARALSRASLRQKGFDRVRGCLFKLAVERDLCFEIAPSLTNLNFNGSDAVAVITDDKMPQVDYDRNLVSYYKVGKASPFASQAFLSYYHVLEYHFLRVAEDSLHHRLRALLNGPSFRSTTDGLDRAISLVRKHDANDDETEMLRKVLAKFVVEEDFILWIKNHENAANEKIYSKRSIVFGEALEISLKEGHALSNAAKILKHVRNAIVHSSDKYSRDECHIPLTESEQVIEKYIPLVMHFAEQVIFATAQPSNHDSF